MTTRTLAPARATWTLQNATARITIEKKTGWIRGAEWKAKKLDLFKQVRGGIPGYIGGLRVYDEHDRAWYSDYETPFTVSGARCRGNTVTLTKQFRGAAFALTVTYIMDRDGLNWKVRAVKKNAGAADRSLRVYFSFPLIAGWDFWAPCNNGERHCDGMTPFEHMYTQIPYVSESEIILPMVSHYNRALGVGYSMVDPIDKNVPAAKFGFDNLNKCYNWGAMRKDWRDAPVLEGCNYAIGLVGKRPMETEMFLFFHEGDWRPGVGMVYRRWQSFFDPFNDAIYEREGVFQCGGIQNADYIPQMRAMGVKTLEVHGHFQDYCDYFQSGKDRWMHIRHKEGLRRKIIEDLKLDAMGREERMAFEKAHPIHDLIEKFIAGHTEAEIAKKLGVTVKELYHTRADIKRRLKALAAAGISCHWYFNYTDGYRYRVERDWPDAICRDEEGEPIPSGWYMCHNMNADPRWSFGKFSFESARKIFKEYPTLDGFFLDCFRHYEIDFAHDDGVTVVNGKPCYSVNRSYDDIERLIKTKIMKPRNLTSFANKPNSIRSMRYVDGQLLEGNGDQYEEKFFWASIASPLFFMWTRSDASLGEFLRRAVWHGCWPREAEYTDANIRFYQKYLPLYAQFRRRVLCFEPDPMRIPAGSRGKLYTVKDGYVAGIINLSVNDSDKVKWGKRPWALFRVAQGCNVSRVGLMFPGDKKMRKVHFKFDGTFIAVPMDGYTNCAVVKLFVTGKAKKKIGVDTFTSKPRMCGDPDSAFEDVSER
ncbi:MAG: hypothetical protein ABIF71_03265 [Planctomycetota bacterium]